ncbi:MAG: gliding motility protein GldM [Bacteroidia bacterium]|nr:gliding motility protein GldM [Bacteroidia bacterium]
MAGGNLSPRQKMIGLMYLVLTALLALNVSKEIINAFVTVNDSLEASNANIEVKNQKTYADFAKAMQNDAEKTKPFKAQADKIKTLSDNMVKYIENVKTELVNQVEGVDEGGETPAIADIKKKDEYDTSTNYLCGEDVEGKSGKAAELKTALEKFKTEVIAAFDSTDDKNKFKPILQSSIFTEDPDPESKAYKTEGKRTWEMKNFYHNPVVACVTLLTKMQTDVRNIESETTNYLLSSISAADFKFDALQARVIAPTSYVMTGQTYEADVFLAAFSSTADPEIVVGGNTLPVENGLGKFTARPSSPGVKKWNGVIKVKKPDNTFEDYPFEAEYTAALPTSVVSPTRMNVFYIGVDNPVAISVPGVASNNVKPSISGGGGTLSPDGKGGFICKVKQQGIAKVSVNAVLDGGTKNMGTHEFRVKRVPDPVAKVAGKKGGKIAKSVLAAQPAIIPVMENFDFELYFKVTEFEMSRFGKGRDPITIRTKGNKLTSEMKKVISSSRSGDKIYFEYIKAVGPDGAPRRLSSVNFAIQ